LLILRYFGRRLREPDGHLSEPGIGTQNRSATFSSCSRSTPPYLLTSEAPVPFPPLLLIHPLPLLNSLLEREVILPLLAGDLLRTGLGRSVLAGQLSVQLRPRDLLVLV
jgi:hypothetical protein